MQNIKLSIRSDATLEVTKTKSGLFGNVCIGNVLIHSAEDSAYNIDLAQYEGQKLPIKIDKLEVIYQGSIIATFDNMIENVLGRIGTLRSDNTRAALVIQTNEKNVVLCNSIPVGILPEHLFDRRNQFPVRIYDDTHWEIVRYANLHQHTDASLLDGMVKIDDLVKKTEWCSAVTDHGNMFAFNEFYQKMNKAGKKPIIGCEVYVETPGGNPREVLNVASQEDVTEEQMFDNEKAPKSTLAGEHMILLASSTEGVHNLFKLVTEASEHFYRKPHVTWELLKKYHGGLIATSACIAGTLGRSIMEILKCEANPGNPDSMRVKQVNEKIADLYCTEMIRLFSKENFYIELQNHHFPLEDAIMQRVREYARKYGLKTTVGIDAHYLNREDASVHEMWLCQQTKKKMTDADRMRFSGDGYYVHTSDEVVDLFPNDLDALDNTLDIAEKCHVDMESQGYHMPKFPLPEGFNDEDSYLTYLVTSNFEKLWEDGILGTSQSYEEKQSYIDRYMYELDVIRKMGWQAYFLVVSDFIAYARDTEVSAHLERYFPSRYYVQNSIPSAIARKNYEIYVGPGRGSAAGSLVCCCLGITKVDPIKYDLLFERFLNPDRVSMPDIDTDFEDSTRENVVEYCRVKYGAENVSRIITFGKAKAKNALRTIARVNSESQAVGSELANAVPQGNSISQAEKNNPDFMVLEAEPRKKELIEYAKRFEGLSTNKSIHACGVLISDKPVVEYMPQILMKNPRGSEEIWTTELQGPECEGMGLLKMDFLGLITLGIAHETIGLIKKNHGVDIHYDEIPLDDVNVYKFLADGNTAAVFQAESEVFTKTLTGVLEDVDAQIEAIENSQLPDDEKEFQKHLLGEKLFMRVSDCNALVRPGPNRYTEEYTRNILGNPEDIHYDHESMRSNLESTGGIMLYQEQVMLLVRKMAGFSAGQADTIRKAMGQPGPLA